MVLPPLQPVLGDYVRLLFHRFDKVPLSTRPADLPALNDSVTVSPAPAPAIPSITVSTNRPVSVPIDHLVPTTPLAGVWTEETWLLGQLRKYHHLMPSGSSAGVRYLGLEPPETVTLPRTNYRIDLETIYGQSTNKPFNFVLVHRFTAEESLVISFLSGDFPKQFMLKPVVFQGGSSSK